MTLAFISGSGRVYPFKHVLALTYVRVDGATLLLCNNKEHDIVFMTIEDCKKQIANYIKYVSQEGLTQFE